MNDKTYRIEHDSMGELKVPDGALWGAQTQRAVDNFPVSGLSLPRGFIRALGLVKWSAAKANEELGMLEPDVAQVVRDASERVASGSCDEHFPIDVFQTGSGTSSNMNANEVIAHLASDKLGRQVHPNDHVNMGQSSNDVIPTAIHVSAALGVSETLVPALEHLAAAIDIKISQCGEVVKTGRTHLMDAMPVTFAQEMGGWAAQVRGGVDRLQSTLPRLTRLAQGGTAVGTGINAHPEFGFGFAEALSGKTHLDFKPNGDYFESLSCQDTAVELSGQRRDHRAEGRASGHPVAGTLRRWQPQRPIDPAPRDRGGSDGDDLSNQGGARPRGRDCRDGGHTCTRTRLLAFVPAS